MKDTAILIWVHIHSDIDTVWEAYILPEHITQWNHANEEWHCSKASNDFQDWWEFHYIMAAKDESVEFDFCGTYTEIIPKKLISYTMWDGRKAEVEFQSESHCVNVLIEFEIEEENTAELQQQWWQAILNNFKDYVEDL